MSTATGSYNGVEVKFPFFRELTVPGDIEGKKQLVNSLYNRRVKVRDNSLGLGYWVEGHIARGRDNGNNQNYFLREKGEGVKGGESLRLNLRDLTSLMVEVEFSSEEETQQSL